MNKINADHIPGAEALIEAFGGIRPMASKLNIPVTTVQGWKKRNVIPANRLAQIRLAAAQNNIDLSGLLQHAALQEVQSSYETPASPSYIKTETPEHIGTFQPLGAKTSGPGFLNNEIAANDQLNDRMEKILADRLARMEKKTITKSAIINLALLIIAMAAIILLLIPNRKTSPPDNQQAMQNLQKKIGALQGDVEGMKKEQGLIETLKTQVDNATQGVKGAVSEAQNMSADMMTGTLEQRVAKLEGHIGSGKILLTDIVARYQMMTQSADGQTQLDGAVAALNNLLPAGPQQDAVIDQTLQAGTQNNPAVAATFEGIPQSDLKAAALLLGMTQFRSSLGRDHQPFSNDLQLLMKLTGENDPALKDSLLKLAPYAESGVLTPRGLTDEFKNMTGDIVVSSLKGEDVSIADKATARLNDMFKLEKNGEPVTGTPTQGILSKTDTLLNQGNLEGAIAQMQGLQGPAAATAAPWIGKAQATLMAQKLKMTLSHAINTKASGNITAGGTLLPNALLDGAGASLIKQPPAGHSGIYNRN